MSPTYIDDLSRTRRHCHTREGGYPISYVLFDSFGGLIPKGHDESDLHRMGLLSAMSCRSGFSPSMVLNVRMTLI